MLFIGRFAGLVDAAVHIPPWRGYKSVETFTTELKRQLADDLMVWWVSLLQRVEKECDSFFLARQSFNTSAADANDTKNNIEVKKTKPRKTSMVARMLRKLRMKVRKIWRER